MKKAITICSICKRQDCDGIEYITEDMWGSYGLHVGIKTVCKNHPNVVKRSGKLMYKLVSGHGQYYYYDIFLRG